MGPIIRQTITLLLLALAPAAVSAALQLQWRRTEPLGPGEVRAATAKLWANHVLWVDTRDAAQFNAGHVKGAVRLNEAEWETLVPGFFAAWDAEKTIVIYGQAGQANPALVTRMKEELKVANIYELHGGWRAWQK